MKPHRSTHPFRFAKKSGIGQPRGSAHRRVNDGMYASPVHDKLRVIYFFLHPTYALYPVMWWGRLELSLGACNKSLVVFVTRSGVRLNAIPKRGTSKNLLEPLSESWGVGLAPLYPAPTPGGGASSCGPTCAQDEQSREQQADCWVLLGFWPIVVCRLCISRTHQGLKMSNLSELLMFNSLGHAVRSRRVEVPAVRSGVA